MKVWRQIGKVMVERDGMLVDLMVLLNNLWLVWEVPEPLPATALTGVVLILAVVGQGVGAVWKQPFVPVRTEKDDWFRWLLYPLLLFHFILMAVAMIMGVLLLGWYEPNGAAEGVWVLLGMGVAAVVTGVVSWATLYPVEGKEEAPLWWEGVADIVLGISILVLTNGFWNLFYAESVSVMGSGMTARNGVLIMLLSLLFVVFYLPGRVMFLVQDYNRAGMWLRVWGAMLPLVILIVWGSGGR
ncbi:MAG TPA: hypothetical protein VLL52_24300 [Anaerolineae bacterium]|nr:hypothetical protein [Anaerolineae bacterium]